MIFRYKIKFISDIEQKIRKLLVNIAVTPFVGVWIEIIYAVLIRQKRIQSLPSWECGLKSLTYGMAHTRITSLPSWECGLKSNLTETNRISDGVTPFVGVWIEISIFSRMGGVVSSLPSWECGLK